MAYNFIAEKTGHFEWENLWHFIHTVKSPAMEVFPIADESDSDPDYLGISIPFHKLDQDANFWATFLELFTGLTQTYQFKLFDLYHGFFVSQSNLPMVKKSLYE